MRAIRFIGEESWKIHKCHQIHRRRKRKFQETKGDPQFQVLSRGQGERLRRELGSWDLISDHEGGVSFEWWQMGTKLKWIRGQWEANVESGYVNANSMNTRMQAKHDEVAKQSQRQHLVGLLLITSWRPKYKESIKSESPSFANLEHTISLLMSDIYWKFFPRCYI